MFDFGGADAVCQCAECAVGGGVRIAADGIRINAVATGGTEAPPRKVPRNPKPMSEQEQVWYQAIIDQTVASSLMKRYGSIEEQVRAILFLASDEASYITGTVLPVGGGDVGMG